jgi:hypothetical protein
MTTAAPDLTIRCSFCSKDNAEVDKIIEAGDTPTPAWQWESMTDEELLDSLPKIASVATQLEDNLAVWVQRARGRGISWARIGAALGMARQSAWERFSGEE